MDKRKVIAAYRRGLLSVQECAQILGMDSPHMIKLVGDPPIPELKSIRFTNTTVKSV
jgi:hypothetical protein